MSEVCFSNRKEPAIIPEDKSWYKKECHKCPYFVHDKIFDKDEQVAVLCIMPIGEECLAKALLVRQLLITEQYNRVVRQVSNATRPFTHKKIKRKR